MGVLEKGLLNPAQLFQAGPGTLNSAPNLSFLILRKVNSTFVRVKNNKDGSHLAQIFQINPSPPLPPHSSLPDIQAHSLAEELPVDQVGLMSVRNTEATGILQIFCRSCPAARMAPYITDQTSHVSGSVDHQNTPLLMEHLFSQEAGPINSACAGSQPALLLDAG